MIHAINADIEIRRFRLSEAVTMVQLVIDGTNDEKTGIVLNRRQWQALCAAGAAVLNDDEPPRAA